MNVIILMVGSETLSYGMEFEDDVTGETLSANQNSAEKYKDEFEKIVAVLIITIYVCM